MNEESIEIKSEFLNNISAGYEIDEKMKNLFIQNSILKKIPEGEFISAEGDECSYFSFVLKGIVRVYKLGETGREITLYRVEEGESCILTASCVMNKGLFPAMAFTETELEAILVPSNLFREWVQNYSFWAKYFYSLLSERLSDVITIIEEVAFKRMDVRIAELLLKEFGKTDNHIIEITHHQIASELGSSREVISRLLKDMDRDGVVRLARNKITLINHSKLISKSKEY